MKTEEDRIKQLQEASLRVRKESMKINLEFQQCDHFLSRIYKLDTPADPD